MGKRGRKVGYLWTGPQEQTEPGFCVWDWLHKEEQTQHWQDWSGSKRARTIFLKEYARQQLNWWWGTKEVNGASFQSSVVCVCVCVCVCVRVFYLSHAGQGKVLCVIWVAVEQLVHVALGWTFQVLMSARQQYIYRELHPCRGQRSQKWQLQCSVMWIQLF